MSKLSVKLVDNGMYSLVGEHGKRPLAWSLFTTPMAFSVRRSVETDVLGVFIERRYLSISTIVYCFEPRPIFSA